MKFFLIFILSNSLLNILLGCTYCASQDASSSGTLAEVLAGEAGDIQVVSLFTESLGEAGSAGSTYIDMIRTNAELIAGGLSN